MFSNDTLGKKILKIAGMVIGGIIFAVVMAFLFGYVFMRLWNWLMPMIFGLSAITFWQGFGLVILAKIIFGGFSGHFSGKGKRFKKDKSHEYNHLDFDNRADFMSFMKWKKNKSEKFHHYWQEEGKQAFEEYLKRKGEVPEKDEEM
jgi:hypothetical protein